MHADLHYTPPPNKYANANWSTNKDKSLSFSQFNKSYTAHRSTEIGTHSPYKSSAVSRLEDAKRTIDSVIVDIEDKRDLNEDALSQIRSVNSDVLD